MSGVTLRPPVPTTGWGFKGGEYRRLKRALCAVGTLCLICEHRELEVSDIYIGTMERWGLGLKLR